MKSKKKQGLYYPAISAEELCGAEMEVIGKEFVRREFRYTPAKGEVVNIYRETAKCPVCSELPAMETAIQFVKANVPEALIPHSYASASAVAWTMYQKYANAMPLYRQEQDRSQFGVGFNRATPANWIIYCSEHYFTALYGYLQWELLKREFLMADETRVQVLKEAGRRAETRCSFSNNLSENAIRPFTVGRKNWLFSDTPYYYEGLKQK